MYVDGIDYDLRVSYAKLRRLLKRKRMSISAFGKNAGISRADLYMMQIDELMSPQGEYNACVYLKTDCCFIRDVTIRDPADPSRIVFYPGDRSPLDWMVPREKNKESDSD